MKNLFEELPAVFSAELTQILAEGRNVRIERIVSRGHASAEGFWYDQDAHEWVIVLRGAARLQFEDETLELREGDYVLIPAHRLHRVAWTTPDEPTVWLAVFYDA
jgi:cupin 2 domain-containing protein